jgi:hypothetical protein
LHTSLLDFTPAQYFSGTIVNALVSAAAYDIDYDDGDMDDELDQHCVLPFEGNIQSLA